MSHVGAPRGRTCSRTLRSVALLTTGVLALPALAACSSDQDDAAGHAAAADISPAGRGAVADGGTLRWAMDAMPATLNVFQADADASTARIAGAVLPSLFTIDHNGRPRLNPDYLETAKIVDREPKQVVLYKLDQQAVWSDGREIGAPDFVAQWQALRGKDSAFWTARNAGYERIEKIERGANDLEVRVTFNKPYADWKSLFSPLYPKTVTGNANAFNDGSRNTLKDSAGPFTLEKLDREGKEAVLVRNPRWWGSRAKLDSIVLRAVPAGQRAAALAAGKLDLADVDSGVVKRISSAKHDADKAAGRVRATATASAPAAGQQADHDGKSGAAGEEGEENERTVRAATRFAVEQISLRDYVVRKSLAPSYTQLALNGESGPLSDDRVRRAVARALDRKELAESVLKPLGLPANALGSHLALAGQQAYADSSDALGDQDTQEAQALLGDAGWTADGALRIKGDTKAGSEGENKKTPADTSDGKKEEKGQKEEKDQKKSDEKKSDDRSGADKSSAGSGDASDDKPAQAGAPEAEAAKDQKPGGMAGAYAPRGTAAPAAEKRGPLGKNGKPLLLRFVLPSGEDSATLRGVGTRISRMLEHVGIRTQITKVADDSFFKDHIASGDYDLALYSWPATAYPATDGRPIFAKPVPASDGSLIVEQNYTRVGTDHIDQLFDQAAGELDEGAARDLMKQADARIWAAAGSIPLYQRPQLVAAKRSLANAGAFGFAVPRYQDIGFRKAGASGAEVPAKK
ncbi:lipoprotein [Streptomyces sp. 150FB]|uniref:ABC transporter family substrate-binding protein n=1 Tax=Streptomyces sp. 150FB TaxID=1576605 RepID=UPI000588F445|nr:ABC transporter family substrate-binding protein [Streptomyces sp. 150FB]KIF76524.1 lipoprotein [Streptomyces sp. 150FB]